jgi:hypothetical protein
MQGKGFRFNHIEEVLGAIQKRVGTAGRDLVSLQAALEFDKLLAKTSWTCASSWRRDQVSSRGKITGISADMKEIMNVEYELQKLETGKGLTR